LKKVLPAPISDMQHQKWRISEFIYLLNMVILVVQCRGECRLLYHVSDRNTN